MSAQCPRNTFDGRSPKRETAAPVRPRDTFTDRVDARRKADAQAYLRENPFTRVTAVRLGQAAASGEWWARQRTASPTVLQEIGMHIGGLLVRDGLAVINRENKFSIASPPIGPKAGNLTGREQAGGHRQE